MMKKVYRKKLGAVAKAAKAKIKESCGGDQFKNLQEWVSFFQENERLPGQKITCSICKKKQTSMFGDNIKRQMAKPKYKTIELLLTKFECSTCRKLNDPVEKPKKEKKVKLVEDKVSTEYLTVDEMEDRKEKVRANLPTYNPDFKPVKIDFNDAEQVGELTNGTCQRPDIYLDYGCANCHLVKFCKASCCVPSRSLEKGDRLKQSKGPKRK